MPRHETFETDHLKNKPVRPFIQWGGFSSMSMEMKEDFPDHSTTMNFKEVSVSGHTTTSLSSTSSDHDNETLNVTQRRMPLRETIGKAFSEFSSITGGNTRSSNDGLVISCCINNPRRIERKSRRTQRNGRSPKRGLLTRSLSNPCLLTPLSSCLQRPAEGLTKSCLQTKESKLSGNQRRHERHVDWETKQWHLKGLQRQKGKHDLMSGDQSLHENHVDGKIKQRRPLKRQNGKRHLMSGELQRNDGCAEKPIEQGKESKTTPRRQARPDVFRKQASERALTAAETKSLDDLIKEYDSIASNKSPKKNFKKNLDKLLVNQSSEPLICDLDRKISARSLFVNHSDHARQVRSEPQMTKLASLNPSPHKSKDNKSSFDDLMDEYDSIDKLEDTWQHCKKSNAVLQEHQNKNGLRLKLNTHELRHTPATALSIYDPLRAYFFQSGHTSTSVMDLVDISEKNEDFSECTDLALDDDLGAIL